MEGFNYASMTEEKRRSNCKRNTLYALAVIVVGSAVGTIIFFAIHGTSFKKPDKPDESCSIEVPDNEKFDCHPDRPVSEKECLKRGCCYKPASDLTVKEDDLINSRFLGVPSCYYSSKYVGYEITSITLTADGIVAHLNRATPSGFPKDIQNVNLEVTLIDDASLRIKITDANATRFEPDIPLEYSIKKKSKKLYDVDLQPDGWLNITRKTTGAIVFKTQLSRLVFSDQFLQLSTYTSSQNLYGLSEQKEGLRKSFNWARYTIFNQGDLPVPNRNLYGTHPFYLVVEPGGDANGVFLLNSNAMDVVLQPAPAVSLRPIGGIFDLFIMLGPTPEDVVRQYTGIVGRPAMIPYWSLGFQLCKYGYFSLNATDEVLQRNLDAGVPIDVQWNDIDFMDHYLDFTYDPVTFAGFPEWINGLHEKGMHYVAMVSPGVSNTEPPGTYPPYDEAAAKDLFVKDAYGKPIESKVWNTNFSVYPDFSNPETPIYWAKQIEKYHSDLDFDGIWLDMNEPLNFNNGTVNGCPTSEIEDPQYLPGRPYPLRTLTICMTAKHNATIHYNEHNLVGYREAHATYDALASVRKKRPFIISRASFAGQGVHSGHWSGDLTSDWEDMRYTIPFMLAFNMYGMPMVGSDICGFRLNTTMELCTRWQALGAFYPFSRNHNDFDTIEQDPAALGSTVLEATLQNLKSRYYLLPYFYTLFRNSHINGDTTVRPLFFEFPSDENTYGIDEEFLWGPALLVMPALYPNAKEIKPYIPKGIWYDFYTGEKFASKGENRTLSITPTGLHLSVRGGYILPLQIPGNNTVESRQNDFDLLVALDENQKASGELFWDDGDSLDVFENTTYNDIVFKANENGVNVTATKRGYNHSMDLNEIKLFGLIKSTANVTINGEPVPFDEKEKYITINAEGYSLNTDLNVVWY
ncbi:hypothetical protein JTE90_006453 [Oedothorax gibbosus]|uniref:P-type domain-containing protein n=1 Tax=Oedothorax gibbosus TaxID=931172 RepID=A0AAV6UGE5_9ARAC|nr:hypothetical protein JTE90_006453 [Oedothorax gibbosus]